MTEFYFVRHGETLINVYHGINGGLVDKPLTEKGVAGAQAMGQYLKAQHFTQALSSSMPRAQKTTAMILKANDFGMQTPLALADGLREMKMGTWDGKAVDVINEPAAMKLFMNDPVAYDQQVAPRIGSETFEAVLRRGRAVIDTAFAAYPAGKLLVVAHGLLFQVLLNDLLGVPFADLRHGEIMRNAALSILTTQDGQHYTKKAWDVLPSSN